MSRREEVMKSFLRYEDETEHRVKNGIELYRKGFAYIKVTDKDGKPVVGKKIKVKLQNHEFLHGANLFMLGEMESETKNEKYKEAFKKCFNQATLPIYWNGIEPREGVLRFGKDSEKLYRRPPLDLCVEFCEENGILPKAHCLYYYLFDPSWIDETDIPTLRKKLDVRFRQLSERYADRIPQWEVINETYCMNDDRLTNYPYICTDNLVEDNFKRAERYFPNNELIINESPLVFNLDERFACNRTDYYLLIERSLRNGARIDSVGMQYHAFNSEADEHKYTNTLYNPKQIYRVLDTYQKLGKPIQITEITIPAFHETKEDYELQAEILRRLYEIWFSHPSIECATYWNLPDGYAAFAPLGDMTSGENQYRGGLLDFNLNPKPAYDMLVDLFNNRWTTELTLETNGNGEAKFLGFYGDYDLVIDGKTEKIKHKKGIFTPKKIVL